MQENRGGAENTPNQDLPHTCVFGCAAQRRGSLARYNFDIDGPLR
jgi:hypothetical protein